MVVTLEVKQQNPKKAGSLSWERYESYKAATTLDELLALGGLRADFKHDAAKGFITVLGGEEEVPAARPRKPQEVKEKKKKKKKRPVEAEDPDLEGVLYSIADGVARVLGNLAQGDCPYSVEECFIFCHNKDLTADGCFRVWVNVTSSLEPDAVTLEKLCGKDEEDILIEIPRRGRLVDASEIVQTALSQDLIRDVDAERMDRKFTHWLEGVDWGQTVLSPTHRPSLDDWAGWPWEADYIMSNKDCGLKRGLEEGKLSVVMGDPPSDLGLSEEKLACFVSVWSRKDKTPKNADDLEAAVRQAYVERTKKRKKKKKKKQPKEEGEEENQPSTNNDGDDGEDDNENDVD